MVRISIFIFMAGLFLVGCGGDPEQQADAKAEQQDSNALAPDEQLYVTAASKLVGQYSRSLQSELLAAASSNDWASAIGVCNSVAPELAEKFSGRGWSIKRVSDRYRNHANRPDTLEQSFLASFADTSGNPPEYLIDWQDDDSTKIFRYYQPIVAKQLCLNCHGDLQTISGETYRRIKKLYPMDKATGYKVGDLRGMVVVEAHWPIANELAELIAAGEPIEELLQPPDTLLDSTVVDSAVDSVEVDTTAAEG